MPHTSAERSDPLSIILHKHYPEGFFSDNLFLGIKQDQDGEEYCAMIMHDLSIQGLIRKYELAYIPSEEFEAFYTELGTLRFSPPIKCDKVKAIIGGNPVIDVEKFDKSRSFEAKIEFYPFLADVFKKPLKELSIEYVVEDFLKSKSNLLLLIGPPGTGKTTLIRSFISEAVSIRLVENAEVLASENLSVTFRSSSVDGKQLLTIYEDADVFVEARTRGNLKLSALLNQLDGVLSSNEKFIISTNLESMSKIDKALLRPGRCHHIFNFRPLSAVEANAARVSVGLERIGFIVPEDAPNFAIPLTNALHYEQCGVDTKRVPSGIGFTN